MSEGSFEEGAAVAGAAVEREQLAEEESGERAFTEADEPAAPEEQLADAPEDVLDEEPPAETGLEVADAADAPDAAADTSAEPLLGSASAEAFNGRWSAVQVTFVEDPHRSVAEADALLTEVLTAYQQAVEQRRAQIAADGTADTEDLRLALLEYRNIITTMVGG